MMTDELKTSMGSTTTPRFIHAEEQVEIGTALLQPEHHDDGHDEEQPPTSGDAPPLMSNADWEPQWVKEKRRNKKKARQWAASNPGPRLALMKETLAPLMWLMYQFLYITGQSFEKKQKHLLSKGKTREYRILLAHINREAQKTIATLHSLLFERPKVLVPQDYSPRIFAIRFRLLAKALCHLHVLIRMPRSGFPYKLFLALEGQHMDIPAVLNAKKCSHDALADLLLRKYASQLQCIYNMLDGVGMVDTLLPSPIVDNRKSTMKELDSFHYFSFTYFVAVWVKCGLIYNILLKKNIYKYMLTPPPLQGRSMRRCLARFFLFLL